MITQLQGKLVEKNPTHVVIDCHGVGYFVNISLNSYSALPEGEAIKLYTYLQIKEDAHTLYGFLTKAEREVFCARVNTVNPRAIIMQVNGLTGQGAFELSTLLFNRDKDISTVQGMELRFPMPAALCSYCLGETRVGENFQMGNIRKMKIAESQTNR